MDLGWMKHIVVMTSINLVSKNLNKISQDGSFIGDIISTDLEKIHQIMIISLKNI